MPARRNIPFLAGNNRLKKNISSASLHLLLPPNLFAGSQITKCQDERRQGSSLRPELIRKRSPLQIQRPRLMGSGAMAIPRIAKVEII